MPAQSRAGAAPHPASRVRVSRDGGAPSRAPAGVPAPQAYSLARETVGYGGVHPPLIRLPPSAAAVESGDRVLCPSFALDRATRDDSSGCHCRMFLVPAARAEERTALLCVEPCLPA